MKTRFEVKSKLSVILMLLFLSGAILALETPSVQSATDDVSIVKELTRLSTGHEEEAPSIALDHNGNLHVVWIGNDTANLYYMLVDREGNVLINETCLDPNPNATGYHVRRASIDVDSENNVHIVFHGQNIYEPWPDYANSTTLDAHEVFYLKINPYLDDMNGSAANYVNITVIPETIISTDDGNKSRAANVAVDSEDNVHVVWLDKGKRWTIPFELHYLVMNKTGGTIVSETNVTAGFLTDVDWSEPEIVVDSQGDGHIFFVTSGWTLSDGWRDIYYTMIEGSTGNVLINNTQLTDSNQTCRNSRPFVDIDSEDMIHIVWHNSTGPGSGSTAVEIFYMKIDPYLDNRNGTSADPEAIKIVKEMLISEDDGVKSFLANIAVDKHGMAHLVWIDEYLDSWSGYNDIYYSLVNATGDIIIPEYRITHSNGTLDFNYWSAPPASNRNPDIAVADAQVFIVDKAYEPDTWYDDIWLTIAFVDKIPPNIDTPTRDPSGDVSEGQPVKILVNVTDSESGVNNDQVILSFTFDNGSSWYDTKMNYNSTSGLYEATIPRQFNCTWVEYKISASDNAGNTAVQDNNGFYYSYHVIPEFPSIAPIAVFMILSLLVTVFIKKSNRIVLR